MTGFVIGGIIAVLIVDVFRNPAKAAGCVWTVIKWVFVLWLIAQVLMCMGTPS